MIKKNVIHIKHGYHKIIMIASKINLFSNLLFDTDLHPEVKFLSRRTAVPLH